MSDKVTAEQAILAELQRVLSTDGEVYKNVAEMLRQALSAPICKHCVNPTGHVRDV